jgi:hypothetical protein
MESFSKLVIEHPYLAMIAAFFVGWLLRHRGVGAGFLPGMSAGPAPAKPSQAPSAIAPAPPRVPSEHPAVTLLQAGIEAGAAKEVMPAVSALVATPAAPKG